MDLAVTARHRHPVPLVAGGVGPDEGRSDSGNQGHPDAFYVTLAQYTVLYVKKGQSVFLFKVYGVSDQAKQMSAEKTLAAEAMKQV